MGKEFYDREIKKIVDTAGKKYATFLDWAEHKVHLHLSAGNDMMEIKPEIQKEPF